ncbi:hypothetical protein IHE55_15610 [Streptomyces pactum]|uniref:Integral membrane protein n=1 Tax=Streptomyces pactum TaxID=68249 RepID=A0ABS0NLQ0_9ACTN|nr:hypothetical protein [Streptomyces pactum]MBH5336133.1 hypothetical protein [Streptomyces pactum]
MTTAGKQQDRAGHRTPDRTKDRAKGRARGGAADERAGDRAGAPDERAGDRATGGVRGRLAALPRTVVRVIRQDRGDDFAVRMLPRVVLGLAAVYTLVQFAASSGGAFIVTCAGLVLGLVAWWLRKRKQLALALVSTTVTVASTGVLVQGLDRAQGLSESAAGSQAVFGFWALAGMAILGAWIPKQQSGGRGMTVLIADVCLLLTAFAGAWVPDGAVWFGFLSVVVVLLLRSRGPRANLTTAQRVLERIRPRRRTVRPARSRS